MKMIGLIIAGALVLVIGFVLFKASKLQDIRIRKSVVIHSTEQKVFDQVVYLKNFPSWSPFYEEDPNQKVEVKGEDGKVGAQYHWNGKGGKDLGFQEIKEIKPFEYIKMGCDIQKPFTAQPVFEYSFIKTDVGVQVTQDFQLKSGLVDAIFLWMFGTKKDIDKTNARGMELLKISLEK